MGSMKGGAGVPVTKYGMSLHFGVCAEADALLAITIKEKEAWAGLVSTHSAFTIAKPELFGGPLKEGGAEGVVYWLPGADDQILDDLLAQKLGRSGGADCPGFRGMASAFFVGSAGTSTGGAAFSQRVGGKPGFYWTANNPYLPGTWIKVRRAPKGLNPDIALIPRLGADFFPSTTQPIVMGTNLLTFSRDFQTFITASEGGGADTYQLWDNSRKELISSGTLSFNAASNFVYNDSGSLYVLTGTFTIATVASDLSSAGPDAALTYAGSSTLFFAGGYACVAALTGVTFAQLYDGTTVTLVDVGFKPLSYFTGPDGLPWALGRSGTDILVRQIGGANTALTISNPAGGTSTPYALPNSQGNIFISQGTSATIISVTGTVLTRATINPSSILPFANHELGADYIWLGGTKYSLVDASVLRTEDISDWGVAGASASVFDPVNNALFGKHVSTSDASWLLLDRGDYDANPAHIIYEVLTNTDWGMGSSATAIDFANFEAVAQVLYDEGLGLSLAWFRQSTIQDFIQEILDHIQGVVYVDPATGLLTLKLVRGDYDPDTLKTIDTSNARLSSFARKTWGDIANEISVTWTNPENEQDETVTVQDLASIAAQGGIITDSRNYYGVRSSALAQRLAARDLRSAGAPLAACEANVSRKFWQARPASVYKLTWPEHGLSQVVMRVVDIDYGRPGDDVIQLSLLEDVYGLDVGEYVEPPGTLWEDTSTPPLPVTLSQVVTMPAFFVQGAADVATYPQVLGGVLATTADADTLSYELWGEVTDNLGGVDWAALAEHGILGHAQLVGALGVEAVSTGVTFTSLMGGEAPVAGVFLFIGDGTEAASEIALITATGTLSRGVLDTIPHAWPAGTPVWLVASDSLIIDPTVRAAGEDVAYKLRTRTSLGLLALSATPILTGTLSERPWLPNRPANAKVDGIGFNTVTTPVDMRGATDVPVTWANRNRLLEDGQVLAWTDGDVAPETGQTTTLTVLSADGLTTLTTHSGLTGTSFAIPIASFAGHGLARVRFSSERIDADGTFESLQAHEIFVQTGALTFDADVITFDADTLTWDEG
jgi:hypothetical protein